MSVTENSSHVTKHRQQFNTYVSSLCSHLGSFKWDHELMYGHINAGWRDIDRGTMDYLINSYDCGFKAIKKLSKKLFNLRRILRSREHRKIMKRELRLINKMLKVISTCKSLYKNIDDDAGKGINNPVEESLIDYSFMKHFDSSL